MQQGFVRVHGGYELRVSSDWWELLESLTVQLVELLRSSLDDAVAEPSENPLDPFAAWEREFGAAEEPKPDHEDPALRRLFPNPYPHDDAAAADHRRFSEPEQGRRKLDEAELVLAYLRHEDDLVHDTDQEAWLRTLNALRLVLATRLGIETASDAEEIAQLDQSDPRWMMCAVMDVIAELQTQLIVLGDQE